VQDWDIHVANRNTYMYVLYRLVLFSMTLSDPNYPQTTSFLIFCIAFHIFVVGGDREFKFEWSVDHSKC